jgi:hypothetical protein
VPKLQAVHLKYDEQFVDDHVTEYEAQLLMLFTGVGQH